MCARNSTNGFPEQDHSVIIFRVVDVESERLSDISDEAEEADSYGVAVTPALVP